MLANPAYRRVPPIISSLKKTARIGSVNPKLVNNKKSGMIKNFIILFIILSYILSANEYIGDIIASAKNPTPAPITIIKNGSITVDISLVRCSTSSS